jgi:hypothetical protein
MNTVRGICLLAVVVGLMACSSPEADWKKADSQGTVAAYEDFLVKHPNDSHATQARTRIQSLEDDHAWTPAQNANTIESLKQYVQTQPNGTHVADAQERITGLERAAAWKVAQADGKQPALQDFLQKYPNGPEADLAKAQLQKLEEAYRVELAASRSKKEAERISARLQQRYAKILHAVVMIPATSPETRNHVRSGPMSLEDAQSACAKLKKAGQHCEVVKS